MKTRGGFVSNSSSSSFVLPVTDGFPNVLTVAAYMVARRDGFSNNAELIKRIQEAYLKGDLDRDTTFHSCNYDTYIHKVKRESLSDFYMISTCNNHDWGAVEQQGYPNQEQHLSAF